jgi:hypothetical protein
MSRNQLRFLTLLSLLLIVLLTTWLSQAVAFDRWKDGCNSSICHGDFTDGTSTKGSVFPSNNKHTMHRGSQYMNADCDLCHSSNDANNPFIGSSSGTNDNPGLGCTGCHDKIGLREHHFNNGQTFCYSAGCHAQVAAGTEDTIPVYYGTVDTDADAPCNPVAQAQINENWTIGDTIGLDNDGDNLYDGADPDCAATGQTPGEAGDPDVEQLLVTAHDSTANQLTFSYGVACETNDNTIESGPLSAVSSYGYSAQQCALGISGSGVWDYPTSGSFFFVLVGNNGTVEGSYGEASSGERPEHGGTSCPLPQDLSDTCVP